MPTWNPADYSAFLEWRTQPSRDLLQRVALRAPRSTVDLGCGPGNSTLLCTARWPGRELLGIDSSPAMIAAARAEFPQLAWEVDDIGQWTERADAPERPLDLIFSCAALQWVPDHGRVFPRLMAKLAPGGVLAAHMPVHDAEPNRLMREMAASARWRRWFPDGRADEWRSHSLEFYHQYLAACCSRLDLWATDYFLPMPDIQSIVDWYRSTGLRLYLERILDERDREAFLADYGERLAPVFPASPGGGHPFTFRRVFLLAVA